MMPVSWPGRLLVAALLALLLVLSIPAHWLGAALAAASGEHLRLVDASGRWYAGSARLYARSAGPDDWQALGQLRWRLFDAAGVLVAELDRGRVSLNWVDTRPEFRAEGLVLPAKLFSGALGEDIGGVLEIASATLRRADKAVWRGEEIGRAHV